MFAILVIIALLLLFFAVFGGVTINGLFWLLILAAIIFAIWAVVTRRRVP